MGWTPPPTATMSPYIIVNQYYRDFLFVLDGTF